MKHIIVKETKKDPKGAPQYFCGHSIKGSWSSDPDDATRFNSKSRANEVIAQLEYINQFIGAEAVPVE